MKLLAAAPRLLSALETLLFHAVHGNGHEAPMTGRDKARAAIYEATEED